MLGDRKHWNLDDRQKMHASWKEIEKNSDHILYLLADRVELIRFGWNHILTKITLSWISLELYLNPRFTPGNQRPSWNVTKPHCFYFNRATLTTPYILLKMSLLFWTEHRWIRLDGDTTKASAFSLKSLVVC